MNSRNRPRGVGQSGSNQEEAPRIRETIDRVREKLHGLDERGRAEFFESLVQAFYDHAEVSAPGGEGMDGRDGLERRALGRARALSRQWRENSKPELVRIIVREANLEEISVSGPVLFDITDTQERAMNNALAWTRQYGYDRLPEALGGMFEPEAPESGYSLLINKPHRLMVIATWPARFNRAG